MRSTFAPHLFFSHSTTDSSGSIRERYRAWSVSESAEIRYTGNSHADVLFNVFHDGAGILIQNQDMDMGILKGSSELIGIKIGLGLKNMRRIFGLQWKPGGEIGVVADAANERALCNAKGCLSLGQGKWNAALWGKRREEAGVLSFDYFAATDDPVHVVQYQNQYGISTTWEHLVFDSLRLSADLNQYGPLQNSGFQTGFASRELSSNIKIAEGVSGCRIRATMFCRAGYDTILVFDNPETGPTPGNLWGRTVGSHLAIGTDLFLSTPEDRWAFEAQAEYFGLNLDHGAVDPRFLIAPLAQLAQGAFGSYQIGFSGPMPDSLRTYVAALGVEKRWKKEGSQFAVGNSVAAAYPQWHFDFEKVPIEYYLVHGEPEPGRAEDNLEWLFFGKFRVLYQKESAQKRFAIKFQLEQLYPIHVVYASGGQSGSAAPGKSGSTETWRGFGGARISFDVAARPF